MSEVLLYVTIPKLFAVTRACPTPPTPYTLHTTAYSLQPTSCTPHPAPYGLDPTPYTLHHGRVLPPLTLPRALALLDGLRT